MNTRPLSRLRVAACAAALVATGLFSGCASSARFSVEARQQAPGEAAAVAYRLRAAPSLESATAPGVSRVRVMDDVRTALSARGMFEAPAGVAAELEIEVELSAGQPYPAELTFSAPVYAGGAPTASGEAAHRSAGGASSSPTKIGEREVTRVVTMYPKRLQLTARRTSAGASAQPLWRVTVDNADEEADLGSYTRLMVAAAMDWVGRTTEEPVEIVLGPRDARVAFLAAGEIRGGSGGMLADRQARAAENRPVDG